ncbi:MAG TPA: hypothetical protein VGD19_07800 [Allosphingosinicella sp.]|jgi:hypothetical protein
MESNHRYYVRRAAQEASAAMRAITPQARERHLMLAEGFHRKAAEHAGLAVAY